MELESWYTERKPHSRPCDREQRQVTFFYLISPREGHHGLESPPLVHRLLIGGIQTDGWLPSYQFSFQFNSVLHIQCQIPTNIISRHFKDTVQFKLLCNIIIIYRPKDINNSFFGNFRKSTFFSQHCTLYCEDQTIMLFEWNRAPTNTYMTDHHIND